jgi:hypothetical protein
VLYLLPALIGLFWGAPLLARELETGTWRLAWSQSVSRKRWVLTKLAVVALVAMATAGLFSLLIGWASSPVDWTLQFSGPNTVVSFDRLTPLLFGARGIAPIGYAAFAVVLGVTIGVLIRRTVPAMAVTLALFASLQIAWPLYVRPHLIPPATQTKPLGAIFRDMAVTANGHQMSIVGAWRATGGWLISNQTVTRAGQPFTGPAPRACVDGLSPACTAWIANQHLRQLITFEPASRFWPLQWSEAAIFVGFAVALAWLCAWRVSRRRFA